MPQLVVRRAREEDREAVLAFCSQTWEWGDYIAYVWDEWLRAENGALFVATMDGHPVGIANLRMLNASEAWMEGMRVDPAFRRQGVATALSGAQVAEARRRGASIVRTLTNATNSSAIRLIERARFRRIGAFAPYQATSWSHAAPCS
jgi:GNAT superfamily N-acetyltransferase